MTTGTGIIAGVSVSHRTASVEHVERACADSQREAVAALLDRDGVREAFVLQTCNRAEAYVVAPNGSMGRAVLDAWLPDLEEDRVRWLDHEASLRHLLRVACGLESVVLGEDQILGQLGDAFEDAKRADGVGPTLEDAVLKALHVGDRARTETAINEGATSLGSAAVRLAATERDLDGATAVVVGAGEMGTLAARALEEVAGRIVVANRTVANAENLVENLDPPASAVGLDQIATVVEDADVVVTATGGDDPVLDRDALVDAGETLVVDLGQPRDVDPEAAAIDGVEVLDLDSIEAVTDETMDRREEAAAVVEELVEDEFDHLLTQYKRKRADQVIAAMYEGAERIKDRELRSALSRLETATDDRDRETAAGGRDGEGTDADPGYDVPDAQREVIEAMADALVGQLLSAPTRSLREAAENDDWTTINTALQLFDPSEELDADPLTLGAGGPGGPGAVEDLPEEVRQQMPAAVLDELAAADDD